MLDAIDAVSSTSEGLASKKSSYSGKVPSSQLLLSISSLKIILLYYERAAHSHSFSAGSSGAGFPLLQQSFVLALQDRLETAFDLLHYDKHPSPFHAFCCEGTVTALHHYERGAQGNIICKRQALLRRALFSCYLHFHGLSYTTAHVAKVVRRTR